VGHWFSLLERQKLARALGAALVVVGCARTPAAAPTLPSALPGVTVLSLDRKAASLPELTRGRPALVAFWATWCTACAEELGELDRLQARLGGDALVVGVAVGEPYEHVADFLRPRKLAYAQLVDEEFKLSEALGERRVPATIVVDRRGAVRYTGGALDAKALAALRSAIAE
jgi:thiol-disulfide isomerase/thioredoxin